MLPTVTFAAEAGAVVVGWALVIATIYRRRLKASVHRAAGASAEGPEPQPAGGLGIVLLVALAAFTAVAIIDGLNLGTRPSLLDAGGAWCIVGLLLRRVGVRVGPSAGHQRLLANGEQSAASLGKAGLKRAVPKFPLIPVIVMNAVIAAVCLFYYLEGQRGATMVIVAAVAYLAMNSAALLTWRLRRGR